jgi:hypothetical protein
VQFFLREHLFGKVVLRRGLPYVPAPTEVTPEHRFYRLLIENSLTPEERSRQNLVIDVGCRNGSYLAALAQAFSRADTVGVELDGNRRYWDLYRRADYARAFCASLETHLQTEKRVGQENSGTPERRQVKVVFGDVRKLSGSELGLPDTGSVLFTLFYPFVSEHPCLKWGLPVQYASFKLILQHLRELQQARPQLQLGLLSAHQGEWEAEEARKSFNALSIIPSRETLFAREQFAELWPSLHPVHVFFCSKLE